MVILEIHDFGYRRFFKGNFSIFLLVSFLLPWKFPIISVLWVMSRFPSSLSSLPRNPCPPNSKLQPLTKNMKTVSERENCYRRYWFYQEASIFLKHNSRFIQLLEKEKDEVDSWIHHHVEQGHGTLPLFITLSWDEYFWPDVIILLKDRMIYTSQENLTSQ